MDIKLKKASKNYGLDLTRERAEREQRDHVFGATSYECLAQIPLNKRREYLPKGEIQRTDKADMMDCASRAPINILESKFNYLVKNRKISDNLLNWLQENGYITESGVEFSDAFTAIKSGTTENGNSLKSPLQAIHAFGLIPKKILPLEQWMNFADYHDPKRITQKIKDLSSEFVERVKINYDRVYESDYTTLILKDEIDVAGYAWSQEREGEIPRTELPPNHAFKIFEPKFFAFDNYIDFDGDFIKKLAPDYNFLDYGYRVYIRELSNKAIKPRYCVFFPFISLCK